MFTELDGMAPGEMVSFTFEGRTVAAKAGMTVAAALLAAGVTATRETPVTGAARGAYCLMGVCFECLMVINGVPNQQACMIPVQNGMQIARQRGAAEIGP